VESLEGTIREKERLRAILETLSGDMTIEEACQILGLRPSRIHELRQQALQGALEALAPGVPGRPPKRGEVVTAELEEVRAENGWLREELELSRARTEIALVFPHLLRDPAPEPEKHAARARKRSSRRSGARSSGTRSG